MTWMPRSLFGRNLLLIMLLLLLGQLASAALVRELVLRPRVALRAESLARHIASLRAGLVAVQAGHRQAFVDAFNRRSLEDGDDTPGDAAAGRASDLAAPPAATTLTPIERAVARMLSRKLATEFGGAAEMGTMAWRREPSGQLSMRLVLDGAGYWVVLPGVLPARDSSGTWIAATLAIAALALVGAWAIQRRLNQPLARVVHAAGELARGATPPTLPEDGPTETATLARSFNQLGASLARAERERALMLAGVSHDLRTPLAKLRLGVEILADPKEPELTASMNRSVEEMDAIIGQFLDFARDDTAEPMLPGDLDKLVRRVADASADHGQPLTLHLNSPLPVTMRAMAMQRAVSNLVENAWRHGRPPVSIETGIDAHFAWVEVCDAGDGIDAAEAESLKQPFRRAQAARSGAPGAGLGLAIVDRIARAHGGQLELLAHTPTGLRARLTLRR